MLEIKKNRYEVDEKIRLSDENNNVIYEFNMQITADELLRIKQILFFDAEQRKKEYYKASLEEKKKLEENIDKQIKKNSEEFENICFKEHKDKFKKLAGEYKYEETVESVMYFFINFFVEKQMKPLNTGLMNLKKFMSNSIK